MKPRILLFILLLFSAKSFSQNVYIPDANFKSYLVGNTAINTNADTEIQVTEAQAFTGDIICNGRSIASLTGIEAFTNITRLDCYNNQLTSLDLSQNTDLIQLACSGNQLMSLNVSQNTALTRLDCYTNQLTSLDLSQNTALKRLNCSGNQLMSLNVSQNTALTYLTCYTNQLTSLDLSQNTALIELDCYTNQLTSLDVSQNTDLTRLDCFDNQLTSLNVSQNTALIYLSCYTNQLTSLNLKNGHNGSLFTMYADDNPSLTCIQVDDAAAAAGNSDWWKDSGAMYSVNCSPLSAAASQTHVSCHGGSNGSATATASGGTAPYTYSWAPAGGTNATATGLSPGTYTVTVADNNAVTASATVTITEPSAITLSASQTNVSTNGGSDGSATVNVSGGTAGYTYSWNTTPVQNTAIANNLAAGNYTVTVTDTNGCTATQQFTITEPAPIVYIPDANFKSYLVGNTAINTNSDSEIQVTEAQAFTGEISCESSNIASLQGIEAFINLTKLRCYDNPLTTINISQNTDLQELFCSNTQLTMLDISSNTALRLLGCDYNQLTGLDLSQHTALTELYCNDNQLTSLNLKNGSNAILTRVRATNNTSLSCIQVDNAAAANAKPNWQKDSGAMYRVNCSVSPLSATASQTHVSCHGGSNGSATVTVSGGTAPYTYSWSPAGGTNSTATGLSPGTYTVTVTDTNAETASATVTITQPAAPLAFTASQTNVSCKDGANGTATVNVTGGTAPYSYSWSPAVETDATATGLAAGTYTVTITDFNGCQDTQSFTITEPVMALDATAGGQTDVACHGGSNGTATVNVTGGTAPYSYSWSPAVGTDATATGLSAGTYTVTITDFNGCQDMQSFTITEPSPINLTVMTPVHVSCHGGSNGVVTVASINGGTSPYTFEWNTSPAVMSSIATNLPAGTYTLTVTDVNGCTASASTTVTQPDTPLSGTAVITHLNCYGDGNGAINVTPAGGTPPYRYHWENGDNVEDRSGLSGG